MVPPEYVGTPERVRVPDPLFSKAPAPETEPAKLFVPVVANSSEAPLATAYAPCGLASDKRPPLTVVPPA